MNMTERVSISMKSEDNSDEASEGFPMHEVTVLFLVTFILMLWSKFYCMAGKAKVNKFKTKEYENV